MNSIILVVSLLAIAVLIGCAGVKNENKTGSGSGTGSVNGTEQFGDTIVTASGLKMIDSVVGNGVQPMAGQSVTVHYTGTFENGKKFDSSRDRKKPFTFVLGTDPVIKGWHEGIMTMKVGGRRRLIIPPQLAYGARGTGDGTIPPNSTLVFDIELLDVK